MASEQESLFTGPSRDNSGDEEDDDISITSTVYEPEGDFDVEELLAERPNPEHPDEMQYLIKWEGYPMDQCTWEPREHLGDGVFEGWEETKAEINAGRRQPFDMRIYDDAITNASMAKSERQARRNAKRKRLSLPFTEPVSLEPPTRGFNPYNEDSDEEDEAVETNEVDPGHLPASPAQSGARPQTQRVISQKIFKGIPSPKLPSPKLQNDVPTPPRRSSSASSMPIPKSQSKPPPKPSSKSSEEPKRRFSAGSTITGYQGTARPPPAKRPSLGLDTRTTKPTSSRPPTPTAKATPSAGSSKTVAPPTKPTSSLRAKFMGKKATRTHTEIQPMPISSVFTQGKTRQKRKNLKDVMSDPTKTPKQFSSMRIQNLARKRGIEMNDAAPANISSIPAAFILNNDQPKPKPLQSTLTESPTNLSPKSPTPQLTPILHNTTVTSPEAIGEGEAVAPVKRPKKKSVRFSDVEEVPQTYENFDPVLGEHVEWDTPLVDTEETAEAVPVVSKKKLTLANYQGRSQTYAVPKTCSFGKNGSAEVQLKFSHIPRQSHQSLTAFLEEEKLHFNRVCTSHDFMFQYDYLCQEVYSSGTLDAEKEVTSMVENVAEHMRRRSSGLYLAKPDFSILVYPTKCIGWTEIVKDPQERSTDSPIGYIIFKSPIDIREYHDNTEVPGKVIGKEPKTTVEGLVKLMMDLDFSALTTHNSKDQDKQVFMLMFPPEDVQLLRLIIFWLRSCQPDCRIFSSETRGSLAKFIEFTKRGTGTVIFHEEVTPRIRRVPLIWQMIDQGANYTFWDLATGRRTPPRYPSRLDLDLKPNQHFLTELFPSGRAFCITPSFVVSDPIRFYDFMQWFGYWCHNPRYLLVTSAEFLLWLHDLCLEKAEELRSYRQNNGEERGFKPYVHRYGLSQERTDALWKAWELLRKIMADYGDEETHEGVRRVMWAPSNIHPDDEQSLVNWFFWWTSTSLDCHRRFFVLGSNARHKDRAYRTVRVPNYDPEQSLDIDKLVDKNRLEGETQERKIMALWGAQNPMEPPAALTTEHGSGGPTGRRQSSFVSQAGLGFPSALFESDRADVLKTWLMELGRTFQVSWATPFWQPISWQDVAMADHFGDYSCEYANFTHWLDLCRPFWKSKNTWYGLFYTPNGKWDPATPSHTYGRHPWIGVFRPVNPHFDKQPYAATELLIWDLDVKAKTDLSDMQLRLIDFVKKEAPRLVCSSYHLETVWYSNTTCPKISPQDHPLDATCTQLREMLADGRYWLPPYDKTLQTRGWSALPIAEAEKLIEQQGTLSADRRGHQQPFPKHCSDADEPVSYVWLPPRGHPHVKHSQCFNDLYEAAYHNRTKHAACQRFRYAYRPTLEWYEEQKREGRGFSYVCVEAGDQIVARLPTKRPKEERK